MYQLTTNGVRRMDDGAEIPLADGNSDYEVYKAWLAAGNTPDPVAVVVPPAWIAGAMADLRARRDRLLDVISGMQADYITSTDMVSAAVCRDVKVQLKAIPTDPGIAAAATRDDFNAAAVARWNAIGAKAPAAVGVEFQRYAAAA